MRFKPMKKFMEKTTELANKYYRMFNPSSLNNNNLIRAAKVLAKERKELVEKLRNV